MRARGPRSRAAADNPFGVSRHAQRVSREVFLALVPIEERAALLRQAARNLGITDEGALLRALRRNGCSAEPREDHDGKSL